VSGSVDNPNKKRSPILPDQVFQFPVLATFLSQPRASLANYTLLAFINCTTNEECIPGTPNTCLNYTCSDGVCHSHYLNNGTECDLGSGICDVDQCVSGLCTLVSSLNCTDNDLCTLDSCDPNTGCVSIPVDCTHLDSECTIGRCDSQTGSCFKESANEGVQCGEINPCEGGFSCLSGVCYLTTDALNCTDGDICTEDFCDPISGCFNAEIPGCRDQGEANLFLILAIVSFLSLGIVFILFVGLCKCKSRRCPDVCDTPSVQRKCKPCDKEPACRERTIASSNVDLSAFLSIERKMTRRRGKQRRRRSMR
jgi:slime mold repeat-containing protein